MCVTRWLPSNKPSKTEGIKIEEMTGVAIIPETTTIITRVVRIRARISLSTRKRI
jgi:hypothetical protein